MVVPPAQLVVVVVAAEVQLAVVALAELEEVLVALVVLAQVQLGVALGFYLDLDHSYGHVVELWSQMMKNRQSYCYGAEEAFELLL